MVLMPEVVTWQAAAPQECLTPARQHLLAGRLAVVPGETTYLVVARALDGSAARRLADLVAGSPEPPAVLLGRPVEVFDWLPYLQGAGLRLARRFWPGPLTLVADQGAKQGHWSRLPPEAGSLVAQAGGLALRVSSHPALALLQQALAEPLLVASLPGAPTRPEDAARMGDRTGLVILDGPSFHAAPSTVVRLRGRREADVLHEGVVPAQEVADTLPCRILFVCTGNTCRSPLAETLCRGMLARHLGCGADEVPDRGFCVQSAGLAAMMGEESSPVAVAVAAGLGGDLTRHRSRPLSLETLAQADHLFAMTRSHLRVLLGLQTGIGPTPRLLSPWGEDVPDPIGGPQELYEDCAARILRCLEARMPEILES